MRDQLQERFRGKYRVKSTRYKGWDYGSPGYYFITLCTKNRIPWFGWVNADQMTFSAIGKIAAQNLEKIPIIHHNTRLDTWIVMPSHIHAVIVIDEVPDMAKTPHWGVSTEKNWRTGTLGAIINQYQAACTRQFHLLNQSNFAWQRGYYDHILRSERSLEKIPLYILDNPAKWSDDEYHSDIIMDG